MYPSSYGDILSTYSQAFYNEEYTAFDGDLAMEDLSSFLEMEESAERQTIVSESMERETLQQPSDLHHQDQVGWLEMEMHQWSGMAKAARSKRRIARQMSNCSVPRFVLPRRISSSSSSSSSSSTIASSLTSPPRKSNRKTIRGCSPAIRAINIFPHVHLVGCALRFSPFSLVIRRYYLIDYRER